MWLTEADLFVYRLRTASHKVHRESDQKPTFHPLQMPAAVVSGREALTGQGSAALCPVQLHKAGKSWKHERLAE